MAAPLVSVCICTHNRARVVSERCVASVLSQDYPNLEVIVAGDGCTDDTEEALRRLGDPRVTFVNRPRGEYPAHPFLRWLVAGTIPMNHARAAARGELMTHLDDDDAFVPGKIRKLVEFIKQTRAELVYHPFFSELENGEWTEWGATEFRAGQVTNGSVLYLSWFKRIECDPRSYRYLEPADWNLYRRLKDTGATLVRYPEPLLRHHRERTQV
jgi:glycosyltransferase involved in cell wall biosynthesis